jgi:hypothetical protein
MNPFISPVSRGWLLMLVLYFATATTWGQATVPVRRDIQAIAIMNTAINAMGGSMPANSVAEGTIAITEGSTIEQGSITIMTRGSDQSAEHIRLSKEMRSVIYSRGEANETARGVTRPVSLELAGISHSADFPFPVLMNALANPDYALEYIALETMYGRPAHHIRFWNTYGSSEKMRQHLSEFSRKDLWFDAMTGLPGKLTYERRESHGAVAGTRMEIIYSDWIRTGGTQYPYRIEKLWNGVPWAVITIQSVRFQTVLSDLDFPVKSRAEVK